MNESGDRFLELVERFQARGAQLRMGDMTPGMLKHLLDSVEEIEVTVKALEDKMRKLRTELGD